MTTKQVWTYRAAPKHWEMHLEAEAGPVAHRDIHCPGCNQYLDPVKGIDWFEGGTATKDGWAKIHECGTKLFLVSKYKG